MNRKDFTATNGKSYKWVKCSCGRSYAFVEKDKYKMMPGSNGVNVYCKKCHPKLFQSFQKQLDKMVLTNALIRL